MQPLQMCPLLYPCLPARPLARAQSCLQAEHKRRHSQAMQDGAAPLFIASQNGQVKTVKLFLEHRADPSQAMQDGATPLAVAKFQGHVEVTRLRALDRSSGPNRTVILVLSESSLYTAPSSVDAVLTRVALFLTCAQRQLSRRLVLSVLLVSPTPTYSHLPGPV